MIVIYMGDKYILHLEFEFLRHVNHLDLDIS